MTSQSTLDFNRITAAIEYIKHNFKSQPGLDEVASAVHLSPFHFQRLFSEWAGTSPKKFLQFTTLEYAKHLLKDNQATLFDTADYTGLSGTSRLHDLFISIEGMTPAEYKQGAKNLTINYSFALSPFGKILIASTAKGICSIAFTTEEESALQELRGNFPNANLHPLIVPIHQAVLEIFDPGNNHPQHLKLHLKGTPFQLQVWRALLKIPFGGLTSYGKIAVQIAQPNASRAVGTAIGSNPVAYLIPCHRVIQASGIIGGYMWGAGRKAAIIGWEGTKQYIKVNEIR